MRLLIATGLLLIVAGCNKSTFSNGQLSNTGTSGTSLLRSGICPQTTFAQGDGSAGNPFQVSAFCDLYLLSTNNSFWSSYFLMTNDIDLSTHSYSPLIAFTGTFDGNGHSILNWSGSAAFFSSNSGTIQNLDLVNTTITPLGAPGRPATLLESNLLGGTVLNCTASGTINGVPPANLDSDNDRYWFVGGLVGINYGTITHSSAHVAVSGLAAVGGLVGFNEGLIQTSWASGSVAGTDSGDAAGSVNSDTFGAGGLVGTHHAGTIVNSFATGSVQGRNQVGGLVGYSVAVITNSYSSGLITGTASLGGLVGFSSIGGVANNSYWDTLASTQAASALGTAENTAAMQSSATFSNWDFVNVWRTPQASYPVLR